MDKSLRLLAALLLLAGSVFGQVESVQVNSSTRNVVNTGIVNYATGQLEVNGVVMPPSVGSPGGGTKSVQYNNAGSFGGDAGFLFDATYGNPALQVIKAQNAVTSINITNKTAGTAAVPELTLNNDGTGVFAFGYYSSATTPYGLWGSGEGGVYCSNNFNLMADGASSYIKFGAAASGATESARIGRGLTVGSTTDPGAGVINANTGYQKGGAEFPIAANGIVKRTAANTYAAAVAGTDYLTGNQTITLSGDVTGSGATAITATIANSAVTYAKMQNETSNTLLGRNPTTAGPPQEISLGAGLGLNVTTLSGSAFVASGASHAIGDVPDPGSTAGTTRYLREDATWVVPSGTPAGSNTQIQFNNSGAFGASANLVWDNTNNYLSGPSRIWAPGSPPAGYWLGSPPSSGLAWIGYLNVGNGYFWLSTNKYYNGGWLDMGGAKVGSQFQFLGDTFSYSTFDTGTTQTVQWGTGKNYLSICAATFLGFVPAADPSAAADTAIYRNAAGVLEVDNGTAGQYRDLIARNVTVTGTPHLKGQHNASTSTQSITADTYLTGSLITNPVAGDWVTSETYHIIINLVKTATGTTNGATWSLRMGTAGTTADAVIASNALGAQTVAGTTGIVELYVTFSAVGASATVFWVNNLTQNTANAFWPFPAGPTLGGTSTSATFNSTVATKIGVSWNPGTSNTHTVAVLTADLVRP